MSKHDTDVAPHVTTIAVTSPMPSSTTDRENSHYISAPDTCQSQLPPTVQMDDERHNFIWYAM